MPSTMTFTLRKAGVAAVAVGALALSPSGVATAAAAQHHRSAAIVGAHRQAACAKVQRALSGVQTAGAATNQSLSALQSTSAPTGRHSHHAGKVADLEHKRRHQSARIVRLQARLARCLAFAAKTH